MDATAATDPSYGYTTHLPGVSFDEARSRIVDALKRQGFGVLTEIDPRHGDAAGEAWLHGRFSYMLCRRPPESR